MELYVMVGSLIVQNDGQGGSIGPIFASGTGRPFVVLPPLQWQEQLGIFERTGNGTDADLHDLLLGKNDFVEVIVNMELEVVSFGTTDASLKVSLRLDRVVRLGKQEELKRD